MGIYEYVLMGMDGYTYEWTSMDSHGYLIIYLWTCVDILWTCMDISGYVWMYMDIYEYVMEVYGRLLTSMHIQVPQNPESKISNPQNPKYGLQMNLLWVESIQNY